MWAEKVSRVCTMGEAVLLHNKFLCQDHFLPTDIMTPEGIRLTLGTEVQYARLHEQCYTTVTCGWKLSGITFD
jgi:hypothetical protein